jgi:hypothetical protein
MGIYSTEKGTVKADLAVLPDEMLAWSLEALLKQAELMKGLAQIYVPVDTGSLRDSIRVERGGEGLHWRQVRVRAGGYVTNPKTGNLVNYAAFVEAKYPYMRPAFEEVKGTIADMIRSEIVDKVKPFGGEGCFSWHLTKG